MAAPFRVELNPPAFQTGARTRYAREPQNLEQSTGLATAQQNWLAVLDSNQASTFRESRDTASLTANTFETGSESRSRTCDGRINNALPYHLATSEYLDTSAKDPGAL
jgi:hypothetical protein